MPALWPRTASTSVAVADGDAAEMAQEVQRHALGGQHAARRAGDRGDAIARLHPAAVGPLDADSIAGSTRRKASDAASRPATTPAWRATSAVSAPQGGRHDGIGGEVAGAAEILQQGGAHRRLDHQDGQG